ncbi:TPA: hypothetical protein ACJ51G_001288 [Aeromonas hydrophila subsp. hydrophila]
MSGLIAELRDKGVDLQPYRLMGIEQIESFNAKRRSLFNPAIISVIPSYERGVARLLRYDRHP